MRYELFLRAGAALDDDALQAVDAEAQGARARLVVERYTAADGVVRGVDLGVALDEPHGSDALCQAAFRLAARLGLSIFDPQLGRAVSEEDAATIAAQHARTSAFADAAPISHAAATAAGGARLTPSARLWLIVVGALLVLLLLARALTCSA